MGVQDRGGAARTDPRTLPVVQQALESIAQGGYPEAVARVGALLTRGQATIPLAQMENPAGLVGDSPRSYPSCLTRNAAASAASRRSSSRSSRNGPWRRSPRSSPIRPIASGY